MNLDDGETAALTQELHDSDKYPFSLSRSPPERRAAKLALNRLFTLLD
jgi:hypothetical protein